MKDRDGDQQGCAAGCVELVGMDLGAADYTGRQVGNTFLGIAV